MITAPERATEDALWAIFDAIPEGPDYFRAVRLEAARHRVHRMDWCRWCNQFTPALGHSCVACSHLYDFDDDPQVEDLAPEQVADLYRHWYGHDLSH